MNEHFFCRTLFSLLNLTDSHIITFVGGGGKTSLINILGKEFTRQKIATLLTTTTHIMRPDFLPDAAYIEKESFEQLSNTFTCLKKNSFPLAALGIPEKVINGHMKWRSPSIDFCKTIADLTEETPHLKILCEGDGSKRLPVKLPQDGEPVFFPKTDTVIGVIGLSCLGKPIEETLFRYELLDAILPADFIDHNSITTDFLYWLCLSEKGLRKSITTQKFCIILNQADVLDEKSLKSVITLRNDIRNNDIPCHIISLKNGIII